MSQKYLIGLHRACGKGFQSLIVLMGKRKINMNQFLRTIA